MFLGVEETIVGLLLCCDVGMVHSSGIRDVLLLFCGGIGTLQSDNGDANENVAENLIDFASFKTFSPLYKVNQLLERRKVRLELKSGDRVRV